MKKPQRIYKVSVEDSSHLRELWSVTFSPLGFVACISGLMLVGVLFILAVFTITPLRRLVGSDSDAAVAEDLQSLVVSMDSLQQLTAVNDSFMRNIARVLDVERTPADSLRAGVLLNSLPVDSLMTGSPAERRFVASMGEQEKYNLKVLSPLAAEGMIFSDPAEGGIVAEESQNRFLVNMIVPLGSGVCAVADGNVVDCYSVSATGTYNIVLQHPNGFVSRYSNVGTPLVDNGARVYSGQMITAPKEIRGTAHPDARVGIELWHDGTPLYPADYIFRVRNADRDAAADR